MVFIRGRNCLVPFLAFVLVILLLSSPVHSQASSKKKNNPVTDEYTKRLVKEMQNQG